MVILTTDGILYAFDSEGNPVDGGPNQWLAQVDSAATSPLLFEMAGTAVGLDILVAEIVTTGEVAPLATRLRWFKANGDEVDPSGGDAVWWSATHAGVPIGDIALGLEVPDAERGPSHPEPEIALFNVAIYDSADGGTGNIYRLYAREPATSPRPIADRTLPFAPVGDSGMLLASADQDGDGSDELLIEAEGKLLVWSPAGRYGGSQDGETLFSDSVLGGSSQLALIGADLDGNGTIEAIAAEAANDSRQVGAFAAGASLLSGWPLPLPYADPAPIYADRAIWCLARRNATGGDALLIATRDGRILDRAGLAGTAEPLFVGGNLTGSPLLADTDSDGFLELHGVSGYEPVLSNSSPEDTLITGAKLRYWWTDGGGDWVAPAADTAWRQGGADARRTRRVAPAGAITVPGAGSETFSEAFAYPNPASETVRWRVLCDGPDSFEIHLYDMEGQERLAIEGLCDGFSPWEEETRLVGLAPGVYFYTIHSDESGRLKRGRLAIVR